MMSIVLSSVLLFVSPAPPIPDVDVFPIGALTGASELQELREAVLLEGIPVAVRRASLDRYSELLKTGRVDTRAEEIASNIREFVEPAADAAFQVEVESAESLRVSGTAEQLRWVGSFLEAASEDGFLDATVDVQIEIYRLPAGSSEAFTTGSTLTPEALVELEGKIAKLDGAERVTAPRVTTNVGARANLAVVDETAYIKDFELTFFPDRKQAVVDPVVGVIQEGLFIDVRALPIAKGMLMLKAEIRSTSLRRPIGEETRTPVVGGAEVTVQVPEVREVKAAVQFEVKEGASAVLSTVDPGFDGEEEQDLLMVIKAVLVK